MIDKMKEIAGDWSMAEPPWWTHFQRPTWQIAMRLRYGLPVTPALRDTFLVQRCLAKKKDGSFCLELLDEHGLHAQNCKCEGAAIHRHDSIRDGLVPAMRPMFTSVKIEQFVYELAQLDDNTGETTEARMDIIAETSSLRAMLDIRCFVSTLTSGWRSTRAHELEKHRRYVTHQDGRRCTNMQLYAAVVNTLGCVGQEFHDFCAAIDGDVRGKGRGKTLSSLLSLLAVYANAEKVLLAHAPPKKRAEREDVIAAIAAKVAAEATAPRSRRSQAMAHEPSDKGAQRGAAKAVKVPEDALAKAVAPAKAARDARAKPAARAEPAQAPRKDATQKKHPKA